MKSMIFLKEGLPIHNPKITSIAVYEFEPDEYGVTFFIKKNERIFIPYSNIVGIKDLYEDNEIYLGEE